MSRELEQEKLYNQFAQEWSEVERLAKRIGAKTGCPIKVCPKKTRWGFYAKWEEDGKWENFAYAHKRKRAECHKEVQGLHKKECLREEKCLCVHTKEKWAIRARVPRSRYCINPTGYHERGEAAAYIDINQDDPKSLEEVASILAKICKARHR
jgi:hypothetical protein